MEWAIVGIMIFFQIVYTVFFVIGITKYIKARTEYNKVDGHKHEKGLFWVVMTIMYIEFTIRFSKGSIKLFLTEEYTDFFYKILYP